MPDACCAHRRVVAAPWPNEDGTKSDRWECDSCGLLFVPALAALDAEGEKAGGSLTGESPYVEEHRRNEEAFERRAEEIARRVAEDVVVGLAIEKRIARLESSRAGSAGPTAGNASAEQRVRDMLERLGVEDAQRFSSGDLVELANAVSGTAAAEAAARRKAIQDCIDRLSRDYFIEGAHICHSLLGDTGGGDG